MNTTMKQRAELRKKAATKQADLTVGVGSVIIALVYAALILMGMV